MTELEYQEYIRRTHHAFCRIVILHAAISESRKLCSRWRREFSLEYLMFEKFVPFSTTDEYFAEPEPHGKYLFTACGQTAVLENVELAAAMATTTPGSPPRRPRNPPRNPPPGAWSRRASR